jgi:hypothetical protein
MPNGIVTETCPAPERNLTDQDIHCFMDEMTANIDMFTPAFQMLWEKRPKKISGSSPP